MLTHTEISQIADLFMIIAVVCLWYNVKGK